MEIRMKLVTAWQWIGLVHMWRRPYLIPSHPATKQNLSFKVWNKENLIIWVNSTHKFVSLDSFEHICNVWVMLVCRQATPSTVGMEQQIGYRKSTSFRNHVGHCLTLILGPPDLSVDWDDSSKRKQQLHVNAKNRSVLQSSTRINLVTSEFYWWLRHPL